MTKQRKRELVTETLAYLHSRGIVHHPANCLYSGAVRELARDGLIDTFRDRDGQWMVRT